MRPRQVSSVDEELALHVPDVHEHVAEEAPHLSTVARVVHQGALHEVGLVGLQHPLVEHDAVAHEHDDLSIRDAQMAKSPYAVVVPQGTVLGPQGLSRVPLYFENHLE